MPFTIRSTHRMTRENKDHGTYTYQNEADSDLNALAVLNEEFGDYIWNVIDLDKEAQKVISDARLARRRKSRKGLVQLLKDHGMSRVRGNLGGVYYE